LDLPEILTTKVEGKWLLTEADHPRVRELYAGYFMIKRRTMLSSGPQTRAQKRKRKDALKHLIIANYDIRKLWRKSRKRKR